MFRILMKCCNINNAPFSAFFHWEFVYLEDKFLHFFESGLDVCRWVNRVFGARQREFLAEVNNVGGREAI